MKQQKVDLPQIVGFISKNQNYTIMFEVLQHKNTPLVAVRGFDASEDRQHLLKDEFILQPFQAEEFAGMLLKSVDILKRHSQQRALPAVKGGTQKRSTQARPRPRSDATKPGKEETSHEATDTSESHP